ncbi:MAG: HEAT repeat domain-containing protein, partial [Planctomycetota bacterium]
RAIDSPSFIKPLTAAINRHEARFTSRGFGRALDTLAYIARHKNNRNAERNLIASRVNHPKTSVRSAAIRALGTLGDPRAIPIVQSFDTDSQANATRQAAESALKKLYAQKELPVEIRDLRAEFLKLKKETESLQQKLDDLNNRDKAKGTRAEQ